MLMVNLMGDLWKDGTPRWENLFAHPQAKLHLYEKDQPRPGRKMGHVLLPADNADHALQQAEILLQRLAPGHPQTKNLFVEDSEKHLVSSPIDPRELQV